MRRDPEAILKTVFGFPAFRGQQRAIVDHVLTGGDCLVLMPTGGGKSLCYQIPALARAGTAIVVSPLIALMQNQVTALRQFGVRAAAMNSALDRGEIAAAEAAARAGELDLLYVAPERLLTEGFARVLASMDLALFAIDEAHCVSQWGHDFRPEYRQLAMLAERFPGVPRMALTATADAQTRADILAQLRLDAARVFVSGFDRPNIRYRIVPRTRGRDQLLDFLATRRGQAGIVYCPTRKRAEETALALAEAGYAALPYHAGMQADTRARHLDRFLKDDAVVMCATVAFGMGIDKPDVRFVAHVSPPRSVEAYYQETGRAGRDGLASETLLLWSGNDFAELARFIEIGELPEEQKRIERQKLRALQAIAEGATCRRQSLLLYFGETIAPCGNCDACLEPRETYDGTILAQKALSAAYRTGQRFGAGHLIDVLVGADTERVRQWRHDEIKTFGAGQDTPRPQWQSVFRQLAAAGLLVPSADGHGSLVFGDNAGTVLKGERRVEFVRDPDKPKRKREREREKRVESAGDEALLAELKRARMALAKAQGVPPYVIFHDTTLIAMAAQRPETIDAFAALPGVGEAKMRRYADTFLKAIEDWRARG